MARLSLTPLGDLTRLRRKNLNNEAFLITEDEFLRCSGALLAARSAPIEEMLENSQNIPAVEFSDDLLGLNNCLDLVYGGSVHISHANCKTIYKFGMIYQIDEMMDGILFWISEELDYTEFWGVCLELKKLQINPSVFINTVKKYLSGNAEGFIQHTTQICQDRNGSTITAAVDLLGGMLDKNILSIMVDIANKATDNEDIPSSSEFLANDNKYLQTVVSSTVSYMDNYSKSEVFDSSDIDRCVRALESVSELCSNVKTLRSITSLIVSITSKKFHPTEAAITLTTKTDLNWELVNTLTSPSTSYDTIRNFTERNEQVLHPCVTAEIVLKWWSVNKNRETFDMGFITSLLTRINSVSSSWYDSVINDSRYSELARALGVTEPTVTRFIGYHSGFNKQLLSTLQQIIRTGGSTVPLPKEWLYYCGNKREYVASLPAFRYSADTVPSHGDISGHWFIRIPGILGVRGRNLSLITTTQQQLLSELDDAYWVSLYFVPNTVTNTTQ